MSPEDLARRVAAIVALAAGADGCCDVEHVQVDVRPQNTLVFSDGDAGFGDATCETACNAVACGPVGALVRCRYEEPADAGRFARCEYTVTRCPERFSLSSSVGACGRRYDAAPGASSPRTVGEALAAFAALEAESVPAFERLAGELRAHGAPEALAASADRAADDERRHARWMAALARAEGAEVAARDFAPNPARSLGDVALENAVEGCVRETWGAVVARWQSERAARADVRRVMRAVAGDELAHAALAWQVHAWVMAHLGPREAARVERARDEAVRALVEAPGATPRAVSEPLGLPTPAEARRLLAACRASLWGGARA